MNPELGSECPDNMVNPFACECGTATAYDENGCVKTMCMENCGGEGECASEDAVATAIEACKQARGGFAWTCDDGVLALGNGCEGGQYRIDDNCVDVCQQ